MSVPALAAPAFAAALFGDRVQTLFTAAGRTLGVIDVSVEPNETFLEGKSLRALVLDYRLLPIAVSGRDPGELKAYRLKAGDRITFVAEIPDLERFVRREPVPRSFRVVVNSFPEVAKEYLLTLVRLARHCSIEEAELNLKTTPLIMASALTRGEARELMEQLSGEAVNAEMMLEEENRVM
jgi:hypothetical protein